MIRRPAGSLGLSIWSSRYFQNVATRRVTTVSNLSILSRLSPVVTRHLFGGRIGGRFLSRVLVGGLGCPLIVSMASELVPLYRFLSCDHDYVLHVFHLSASSVVTVVTDISSFLLLFSFPTV